MQSRPGPASALPEPLEGPEAPADRPRERRVYPSCLAGLMPPPRRSFTSILRTMASEFVSGPDLSPRMSLRPHCAPLPTARGFRWPRPTGASKIPSRGWIRGTGFFLSSSSGLPALHNTMATCPDHLRQASIPKAHAATAKEPAASAKPRSGKVDDLHKRRWPSRRSVSD